MQSEREAAIAELITAVRQFVARVEAGEVRSVKTYNRFRLALAMMDTAEAEEEK